MKSRVVAIVLLAFVLFTLAAPQAAFAENGRRIQCNSIVRYGPGEWDWNDSPFSMSAVETTTGIRITYSNDTGSNFGRVGFKVIAIYQDSYGNETSRSTRNDFEIITARTRIGTLNVVFLNSSRIGYVLVEVSY